MYGKTVRAFYMAPTIFYKEQLQIDLISDKNHARS